MNETRCDILTIDEPSDRLRDPRSTFEELAQRGNAPCCEIKPFKQFPNDLIDRWRRDGTNESATTREKA